MLIIGVASFFFIDFWYLVLIAWLIRTIGNGVVGHRYFAHNQFVVGPISRKIFAYYTSICGYSTPFYWIVQHLHHHRNSDSEVDVHSPKNGLWNSMLLWMFKPSVVNSIFSDRSSKVLTIKTLRDNDVTKASKHFVELNLLVYGLLLLCGFQFFAAWAASYVLELLKFGLINTVLHIKNIPGNYRNHDLKDDSYNNLFLGFLTMGFGWHNNHHADSKKLNLQEKWWEFDLEGHIGKLFSKIFRF